MTNKCQHEVYGYTGPPPTDVAVSTVEIQCSACDRTGVASVLLDWGEEIASSELGELMPGDTINVGHVCNEGRRCKLFQRLVQHAHRKFGKSNYISIHTDGVIGFTRIR